MSRPRIYSAEESKARRKAAGRGYTEELRQDPQRLEKRRAYLRSYVYPKAKDPVFREKKKENSRRHRYARYYGITVDDRNRMFAEQDGCCAVCRTPISLRPHPFEARAFVDHDHDTGIVRGLLCHRCNLAEGLLRSDPAVMRRLAEYVESARKEAQL